MVSFSEADVDTITSRMQMIIEEGSDHIKDLELKIKTQGKGEVGWSVYTIWNRAYLEILINPKR